MRTQYGVFYDGFVCAVVYVYSASRSGFLFYYGNPCNAYGVASRGYLQGDCDGEEQRRDGCKRYQAGVSGYRNRIAHRTYRSAHKYTELMVLEGSGNNGACEGRST